MEISRCQKYMVVSDKLQMLGLSLQRKAACRLASRMPDRMSVPGENVTALQLGFGRRAGAERLPSRRARPPADASAGHLLSAFG